MAITTEPVAYVRTAPIAEQPPPMMARGWLAWMRENLFSSVGNTILTLIALYIIYLVVPPAIRFFFIDAVWTGSNREACLAANVGREVGACWAYVNAKLSYFVYGSYPWDDRWRVDIVFALGAFGIAWLLWLDAPKRGLGALYFFVIFPIAAFILLRGWPAIGLQRVDTSLWGGILVTLIVSIVGIVV